MSVGTKGRLDLSQLQGELAGMYTGGKSKANFLVYSYKGAGKTHLLGTAPKPILIHSFDPGGTRVSIIQDGVADGSIMVDTRFESVNKTFGGTTFKKEDSPFNIWKDEVNRIGDAGLWERIATYCLDSGTFWQDAVMLEILRAKGGASEAPTLPDYGKQQIVVRDCLSSLLALPCHFIMTGHIEQTRDDITGKVYTSLLATGKLKAKIPPMFDEYYVLVAEEVMPGQQKGTKRYLLTTNDGKLEAGTRIGSGKFAQQEEPDIRALLKKAGYAWEDKT